MAYDDIRFSHWDDPDEEPAKEENKELEYYDDPDDGGGFYQWAYGNFDDDDDYDDDAYDDEGYSVFSHAPSYYDEPPNSGECSMCGGEWSLNPKGRCGRCEQIWNS